MEATHLHLILVHIPIVGSFIGLSILTYGLYSKNSEVKRTALAIFVLIALVTIAVFFSGDEAEDAVGHLPGVSSKIIDEHEDLAEIAVWAVQLLGLLSLGGLYAMNKKLHFAKSIVIATLVASVAVFALLAQVGNLGGQIRHSEIRDNPQIQTEGGYQTENHYDDEDDH